MSTPDPDGLTRSACKHCGQPVIFGRYGKRWVCLTPHPDGGGRYEIVRAKHPAQLRLLSARGAVALAQRGGACHDIHARHCKAQGPTTWKGDSA